jgi:general secretion pathway protein A
LKQRIVLRYNLAPFNDSDTSKYIASRFATAGLPEQTIFSRELIAEIHRRSQGIPRLINAVCDNLLLTAFADASKVADFEMLDEVSRDMRLEWGRAARGHRSRYPETESAPVAGHESSY